MPASRRSEIVALLRYRLLRAVQVGSLAPGARVPGTRTLASELGADPRVVAAALHELASEGLVELRPRSGAYLTEAIAAGRQRPMPSIGWAADVIAEGIVRGIPAPALTRTLGRMLGTRPVRATVIAATLDQGEGLRGELEELLGMEITAILARDLPRGDMAVRRFRRTELFISTPAHAAVLRGLSRRHDRPHVLVDVRTDLFDAEWRDLPADRCYLVVADAAFARGAREYLVHAGLAERVQVRIVGKDRLDDIPRTTPVYMTRAARQRTSTLHPPGDLLPPARMISDATLRTTVEAVLAVVAARSG